MEKKTICKEHVPLIIALRYKIETETNNEKIKEINPQLTNKIKFLNNYLGESCICKISTTILITIYND